MDDNFLNTCCTESLKMLKLNRYFWHDLILTFQVSQKAARRYFCQTNLCAALRAVLEQMRCCLSTAPARELSGRNCCLSPGEHIYLTAKDCMTYLGISGRCLHGCTQYILQSTSGIPFWRQLTGTRAMFSQFTAQETGCEHGVQWNLQDWGL